MNRTWRLVLLDVLTVAISSGFTHPATPADVASNPKRNTIKNTTDPHTRQIGIWAIRVNGVEVEAFGRVLRAEGGSPLLTQDFFNAARLKAPATPAVKVEGDDYFPLDAVAGSTNEFDPGLQTLSITVPPAAFVTQTVDLSFNANPARSTSETGGFLNYDFNYTRNQLGNQFSLLTEAVLFSPYGSLSNRYIARTGGPPDVAKSYRLDTQFVREVPENMAEFVVGDSLSAGSGIARQLYFGGVQWRRRFVIRPDYQILPLPVLSGVASAPSLVDIYVDNILRLRQPVDTGPFALNNLPLLSGQGDIRLVVNDVLGRQQVISQPYLLSPLLLKAGTEDFSYETGFERFGFGTPFSRYRQAFISGTRRVGLTKGTVEWHGEATRDKQATGVGYAVPAYAHMLSAGVAVSRSTRGIGHSDYFQFERVTPSYSYSGRVQRSSTRFTQLGIANDGYEPTLQWQAQVSKNLFRQTSLSLSYLDRRVPMQPDLPVINASMNTPLPYRGFLSVGMSKLLALNNAWAINASLFFALGDDSFTQVNLFKQGPSKRATVDLQKVAPVEQGWGYRARQTMLNDQATDIGVNYNNDIGQYSASASYQAGQQTTQIQGRGGIATLGSHLLLSRWIESSFAVVEVPIDAAVDIYANNRKVSQTQGGVGIISQLVPYVANRVYLDDKTLPVNVSLDLEQKSIVPPARAGLLLKFSAVIDEGAVIELVDEQHVALPTGTTVTYRTKDGMLSAEIGLRGVAYLPRVNFPLQLQAFPKNNTCTVDIDKPANLPPLARIGPLVCKQVSP